MYVQEICICASGVYKDMCICISGVCTGDAYMCFMCLYRICVYVFYVFIQEMWICVSGVYTGDVYDLLQVPHNHSHVTHYTMLGQFNWNGSVSIIKTHEGSLVPPMFQPTKYDQAVVIIRSPYNTIMAEFNRQKPVKNLPQRGIWKVADPQLFYTTGNHIYSNEMQCTFT